MPNDLSKDVALWYTYKTTQQQTLGSMTGEDRTEAKGHRKTPGNEVNIFLFFSSSNKNAGCWPFLIDLESTFEPLA